MKRTTFLLTTLCLLAACGEQGGGAGQAGGKGDISQNRTTAFKSFMPTFSSMGKVVKGDDAYDVEKFKALAASFKDEARAPFEYFQNDPQGNGDALPEIWAKPAEFKAEHKVAIWKRLKLLMAKLARVAKHVIMGIAVRSKERFRYILDVHGGFCRLLLFVF